MTSGADRSFTNRKGWEREMDFGWFSQPEVAPLYISARKRGGGGRGTEDKRGPLIERRKGEERRMKGARGGEERCFPMTPIWKEKKESGTSRRGSRGLYSSEHRRCTRGMWEKLLFHTRDVGGKTLGHSRRSAGKRVREKWVWPRYGSY